METMSPASPTQRCHPCATPSATASRAFASGGNTPPLVAGLRVAGFSGGWLD